MFSEKLHEYANKTCGSHQILLSLSNSSLIARHAGHFLRTFLKTSTPRLRRNLSNGHRSRNKIVSKGGPPAIRGQFTC